MTPAQIALAWILHKPGVTAPIIGASKMEQFEQSLAALDVALDATEMQFLEEPYKPHAVLGEARITAVSDDLSEAILLLTEQTGDVRELDKVITK